MKKSIKYYEKIRNEFPNSDFYLESIYRLGDIYFNLAAETNSSEERKKYLLTAEKYYELLILVESELVENAIYKLGWTYFSMNKYAPAIVRFLGLLNDITLNDSIKRLTTNPEERVKAEQFLKDARIFEEETIEYVALSFAGFDSTNYSPHPIGTEKLKNIINNIGSKIYAKKILERLGDIYAEIDYPAKACSTYSTFLDLFPLNSGNPSIDNKIIQVYINNGETDKAEKQMEKLALRFNRNSGWYQKYKNNKNILNEELPIVKEAYEYTINRTVNKAIDNKEKSEYLKAIKFSDLYLDIFPDSDKSQKIEARLTQLFFELAEQEKDIVYYKKAIKKFQNLNKKSVEYPSHYDNTYDIIVAYQSILDILKEEILDENSVENITEQDTLYVRQKDIKEKLLTSCDTYRQLISEKKNHTGEDSLKLYQVVQLQGNFYYDENNYVKALSIFKEIINNFVPILQKEKTTNYTYKIALCYKNIGDYVSSEEWFWKAESLAVKTDNQEIKESANLLALQSIQNHAGKLEQNGDYISAAQQYERIAKQDLKAEYSFDNMLKSAELYEKANDFEDAIRRYLFIAENYPNKDKVTQILPAYYKAATLVDTCLQNYEREISIYQKIVNRYPNSEYSRNAEKQIVAIYDYKLGDKEISANKYIELTRKYKDWDKAPDMFNNAIINYQELGNTEKVIQLCLQFAQIFPDNPSVLDKLKYVLREYIAMDKWDKAEEIAIQIKDEFPEEKMIATGIARKILNNIETEMDTLYKYNNFTKISTNIKEYYNKNNYFIKKGIILNLNPVYVKLRFYEGEVIFNDLMQDSVRKTIQKIEFDRDIKRLLDKRNKLIKIYGSVKEYNNAKWWAASLHRLGQTNEYLFRKLDRAVKMFAPVYDDEINQEAFKDVMTESYIDPIYDEMLNYYYSNFIMLEENGIENEWTLASKDKLYEYGIIKKLEENLITSDTTYYTDNTWKVNTSIKEDKWFCFGYNDSLWRKATKMPIDSISSFSEFGLSDSCVIWDSLVTDTVYFRYKFVVSNTFELAEFKIAGNSISIYINGEELTKDEMNFIIEDKFKPRIYDITNYITIGENLVAIKASTSPFATGIIAEIHIIGFKNQDSRRDTDLQKG